MKGEPILFSDMRGSLAGITFTKGIYPGVVARKKVSPVNPNTTLQSVSRSSFSGAVQLYNDLSDSDRVLWDVYGDSVTYPGPLGDYTISGRLSCIAAMQFTLNESLRLGNVADVLPSPPSIMGKLNLINVNVDVIVAPTSTGLRIGFENPVAEDIVVVGSISRHFQPTRNTFKGPFQASTLQSTVVLGGATGSLDFFDLVEDGIYFIQIRGVTETAPHRISSLFIVRGVAITTGI